MYTHSESPLTDSDAELLNMLTGDNFPSISKAHLHVATGKNITDPIDIVDPPKAAEAVAPKPAKAFARRDAALDPLLLAAAFASGPDVTRNHYSHDFFPGVQMPTHEGSFDWRKLGSSGDSTKSGGVSEKRKLCYVSKQMPRKERLSQEKENTDGPLSVRLENMVHQKPRRASVTRKHEIDTFKHVSPSATVEVKCMARTRIPTPYGPVFLHLYHNSKDQKEHLALVVDGNQIDEVETSVPYIRSRTLDSVWDPNETDLDRVIRGAYVGKLGPNAATASRPHTESPSTSSIPPPLIRLHSECFTGETIGSMRCDCGEQLAEALRLISSTPDRRGVVVYLRQEGRGIGLLNKIKAYNLQDMGADTVMANELLGFGADERGYEVVGGILRDLGLAPESESDTEKGVRLLTNNPEKVMALEKEGVRIVERVGMVPRSWQSREDGLETLAHAYHTHPPAQTAVIPAGGILGASAPYGADLDKYLRTKVEKMGHILPKHW